VCGSGAVVCSWSLLFAAIIAAFRQKLHSSACSNFRSQLSRTVNWRARFLFNAKDRVAERARIFQDFYYDTGQEPGDLTEVERKKLIGHLEENWFAKMIIYNFSFNALTGFLIILIALNALR